MSMNLRPMQYLALECTECGLPLERHAGAAGDSEINAIELLATNLHERYRYISSRCNKCGKLRLDRHEGSPEKGDLVSYAVKDYGKEIAVAGRVVRVYKSTLRVETIIASDERIEPGAVRAVKTGLVMILEKSRNRP